MAVDPRRPGEQAVTGRVGDQVVEIATPALRGDGEAAVLDPRPRVDEVGDVLACGAPTALVALRDRAGPRTVLRERAAVQDLVQRLNKAR